MRFIADFHIHSRYSRATSVGMDVPIIAKYAKRKGIKLMGTGDFTHPQWFATLKELLKNGADGLFKYDEAYFILTAEVCNIFKRNDKTYRIHNLIFAPSFEIVGLINRSLQRFGELTSDGRPILKLDVKTLVKLIMDISSNCMVIPAHIWTPWFSLFGSNSGFDTIEACFEEQTPNIYALETGLSSDPPMNWLLSALDKYTLISNSDSHSPAKIGREANLFDTELTYSSITDVLKRKDRKKFLLTIEFFPQEGKYHYDGHRDCNLRLSPEETVKSNYQCPECGRRITMGVLHRVKKLADREEGFLPANAIPYKNLVPLEEIISKTMGKGIGTVSVESEYLRIIERLGPELEILLNSPKEALKKLISKEILDGILAVREGRINILPGYDGVYGEIEILRVQEKEEPVQLTLF